MLAEIDRILAEAVQFSFKNYEIEFQFPPRIITDGRRGQWNESQLRGDEPLAIFGTSGAREIGLEWTYIVGEAGFTTTKVSTNVRNMRAYFSKLLQGSVDEELVILYKHWRHGGRQPFQFRMLDVDVRHGKAIIAPDGDADNAYPLRTDIRCDLRLWTRGGAAEANVEAKNDKAKLEIAAKIDWL